MRNSLTRRQVLALIGASVLLGSACGPGPSPSPTAAPAKPAAPAPAPKPAAPPVAKPTAAPAKVAPTPVPIEKLRYGTVQPLFWQAPIYLGMKQGIYAKRGLEIEYEHVTGSPNLMKAFLGGQVDGVTVNAMEQMTAIENGADIKIIGVFAPGVPFMLFARDTVANLKDLRGRTVGISQAAGFPQAVVISLLESVALSRDDVTWVTTGTDPDRIRALAAGRIDAALTGSEYKDLAQENGLKVLSVVKKDQPRFISQTTAFHGRVIKERPQLLVRFLGGSMEAIRYALAHKEEVVAQEAARLGLKDADVRNSFDWNVENDVWQPDAYVEPSTLDYMQDLNVRLGYQKATMPMDKIATWEFQKAALDLVGPYKKAG